MGCYAPLLQGSSKPGSNPCPCIAGRFFTIESPGSPQINNKGLKIAVWCTVGENYGQKNTKGQKTKQKQKPSAATSEDLRGKQGVRNKKQITTHTLHSVQPQGVGKPPKPPLLTGPWTQPYLYPILKNHLDSPAWLGQSARESTRSAPTGAEGFK